MEVLCLVCFVNKFLVSDPVLHNKQKTDYFACCVLKDVRACEPACVCVCMCVCVWPYSINKRQYVPLR